MWTLTTALPSVCSWQRIYHLQSQCVALHCLTRVFLKKMEIAYSFIIMVQDGCPYPQHSEFAMNATDLSVLEVLLELLQHDSELLGLHPTVGQQHAAKLPLCDPPLHRVVPLKLEGEIKKRM